MAVARGLCADNPPFRGVRGPRYRCSNERSYTVLRKPIAAEVLRRAIATAVAA